MPIVLYIYMSGDGIECCDECFNFTSLWRESALKKGGDPERRVGRCWLIPLEIAKVDDGYNGVGARGDAVYADGECVVTIPAGLWPWSGRVYGFLDRRENTA